MGKEEKVNLLNEIIERYFTRGEGDELITQFQLQINNKEKISETGSKYPDPDFFSSNLNTRIDLLITFAEKKFPGSQILGFLSYLGEFAITSGEFDTALDIYNRILKISSQDKKFDDITANANLSIGDIYSRQAKWTYSIRFIKRALTLFKSTKNQKGIAKCQNLFGTIYGDTGDILKAKENFELSFDLLKGTNDLSLLGMVEINLGIINLIQEDFEAALIFLKRALVNFKQIGNYKRIAEIHYNTGMAQMKLKDYNCALQEFDESISAAERLGYMPLMVLCYLSKAQVYIDQNDNILASAFADRSLELAYRLNDKLSVADIYKIKGVIQKNLNNYTAAENCFLTSLRINKEVLNKYNYAETSFELGLLYKQIGREKESKTHFNNAKNYYKRIKAFNELKKVEVYLN